MIDQQPDNQDSMGDLAKLLAIGGLGAVLPRHLLKAMQKLPTVASKNVVPIADAVERHSPWLTQALKHVGGPDPMKLENLMPGQSSLPFGVKKSDTDPIESVLKLYRGSRQWGKQGYEFRPPRDIDYAKMEKTLPILPTLDVGSHPSGELHYIVQPHADMIEPAYDSEWQSALRDIIRRTPLGYNFFDYVQPRNIGMYQNKPYVLDTGGFTGPRRKS